MTSQRQIIVNEVFSHHDHFDAEDLMYHLRERISSREVSRPTVYRTLGELVEAGLLRRMVLRDRYVYEHEYGYPEHDHLYCQSCHQLFEFHTEALLEIRDARDNNQPEPELTLGFSATERSTGRTFAYYLKKCVAKMDLGFGEREQTVSTSLEITAEDLKKAV